MEARILERVELSNAGVVAAFRDEAQRATSALRETFQYAKDAGESAKKTVQELRPVIVEVRKLADDATLLRRDLKIHDESHRQMVECANTIEVSVQSVQQTVMRSTKESRANWITRPYSRNLSFCPVFAAALVGSFARLYWDHWLAAMAYPPVLGFCASVDRRQEGLFRAIQACGLNMLFLCSFCLENFPLCLSGHAPQATGGWLLRREVNLMDISEFIVFL